jgi:hypothetical protein
MKTTLKSTINTTKKALNMAGIAFFSLLLLTMLLAPIVSTKASEIKQNALKQDLLDLHMQAEILREEIYTRQTQITDLQTQYHETAQDLQTLFN